MRIKLFEDFQSPQKTTKEDIEDYLLELEDDGWVISIDEIK